MRVIGFVCATMVIAPAVAETDAIGLAMFTVTEDGATRVVMNDANGRVSCGRWSRCAGDGCTPVPTTTFAYASMTTPFVVSIAILDPITPNTTYAVQLEGSPMTASSANVTIRTTSQTIWPLQAAGTVQVLDIEYHREPFRGVITFSGITDGTRMIEGSIECPDVSMLEPGSGGGCGGGGGGGGVDD